MSEFGTFLENQADTQKLTAKEMASRMGVPASMLSQFIVGEKTSCRPFSLMKIIAGISDDPQVQAELLEAYLRDQCTDRYKSWIRVEAPDQNERARAAGMRTHEKPAAYGDSISQHAATLRTLKLANKLIGALTDIARGIPGRPKFRTVIEDLGKFSREELTDRPEEGA